MKTIVCAEWGEPLFGYPATVILYQTGVDRFAVRYGKQFSERLTYERAAAEFGQCVMHAAACNGHLDNRMRGEHGAPDVAGIRRVGAAELTP